MREPNQPTVVLSGEEVAAFHRDGFLSVARMTTDREVERLREAYDELFARRAGREDGMHFDLADADEDDAVACLPQMIDPWRYSAAFRDTVFEANALAVSRQLFGPEASMHGSHAILKPAHIGCETPWHQDEAYWAPELDYRALSALMPLQEATIENGCMWFVPGSHRRDLLPHHHLRFDPRSHALEVDDGSCSLRGAVACPLAAGGATFHHSRTLHYAGANRTASPRRAFVLGFGTTPQELPVPRALPWQRVPPTPAAQRRAAAQLREQTRRQ
ncbi:MAG: phytanoyl-CoA dioxygenase family protein [Planctomycetes bacterium]|nr:phytanoyl-CoA dioxygenase family protein [Planctomycetota bacterium]